MNVIRAFFVSEHMKRVLIGIGALSFLFILALSTSSFRAYAQEDNTAIAQDPDVAQERSELEQQLAELEREIDEHQQTIEEYKKQGGTLKTEINVLNSRISKLNLQVKALNLSISKLDQNINETQRQINQTENAIDSHRGALAESLRTLYDTDRRGLAQILLANETLSDFFGSINDLALVQDNLRIALTEITRLRQDLLTQKEELALEKSDAENLKFIQERQRSSVQSTQSEKANLLSVTKGKESEYQKLLAKTQASAAQIRTRIFELLGGGELTFEKAYEYARLAESATGVRAALILAILHRESLLGKNVGRCSYETAMHPTRDIPYFLDLLGRLNIDPVSEFAKVSCANQHGSYGGAMGPAQFIPSTWKIYESKITAVTGNNPPSPWNNSDAFTATAVYIEDLLDSSSCRSYASENQHLVAYQTLLERCAAAKYYAGGNWYRYRFWYGDPVVTKANEFEDDIRVLQGTAFYPESTIAFGTPGR